jgi:hypothetical protein
MPMSAAAGRFIVEKGSVSVQSYRGQVVRRVILAV